MKPSVYLETTIISYLAARRSRNLIVSAHQKITHDWWNTQRHRFDVYVSEAVLQESRGGDPNAAARRLAVAQGIPLITVTPEHGNLSLRILRDAGLPDNAGLDALHVAIAAMQNIDVLLTWNCKHIASPRFRPRIESVCRGAGLKPPEITTPVEMEGI